MPDNDGGPSPIPRPHGTIPALDGFRAIAIILVMLSHVGLDHVIPGQFGVTLFFFLSGYLITTLLRLELIEDGRVSLTAFYFRRAVRILPPMWLAIALAVGLSVLGAIPPLKLGLLPVDFLFLTNYLPHSGLPIGLWSLAVEEHFYLLFPAAAMALVARRGASACALVCAIACAIILGVRVEEAGRLSDIGAIGFLTHTRLDSILFGAILALWNNPVIDRENRLPPIATSYVIGGTLLLIGFIIRDETFRFTIRYTIQGVGLLLIFNAAIRDHRIAHRILETAPLKFVGALSYMLYLVHSTFIVALMPLSGTIGTLPSILIAFALSFAFAYGARVLMEKPLARWRRTAENNWRSRRSTTAALDSSP